jgi:hypothetical protein
MHIDIRLTPEQIAVVPDFGDKLAESQTVCDKLQRNVRDKARLCIHEASHAQQYRSRGVQVRFHPPHLRYDRNANDVQLALGGIEPIRGEFFSAWEEAATCIAGFLVTERLTGLPDEQYTIDGDLQVLRNRLGELPRLPHDSESLDERIESAVSEAECVLLSDIEKQEFLRDLEQATRDYEREIYHTDDVWDWSAREYRFDLPGERYAVALPSLGYFALLIDDGGRLRFFFGGREYTPDENIHGYGLEAFASTSSRKGAADAVRRWNEMIRAAL